MSQRPLPGLRSEPVQTHHSRAHTRGVASELAVSAPLSLRYTQRYVSPRLQHLIPGQTPAFPRAPSSSVLPHHTEAPSSRKPPLPAPGHSPPFLLRAPEAPLDAQPDIQPYTIAPSFSSCSR